MTPAERALEIFNKFYSVCKGNDDAASKKQAKQCALIMVDELIAMFKKRNISSGIPFLEDTRIELEKM